MRHNAGGGLECDPCGAQLPPPQPDFEYQELMHLNRTLCRNIQDYCNTLLQAMNMDCSTDIFVDGMTGDEWPCSASGQKQMGFMGHSPNIYRDSMDCRPSVDANFSVFRSDVGLSSTS